MGWEGAGPYAVMVGLAAGEASRGAIAGGVSRLLHRASTRHRTFLDLEESLHDLLKMLRNARGFLARYAGCRHSRRRQ